MRARDRTALALAPLFLRLALALTFVWAGLGKFVYRFEVQGEQAAILANYGVLPNPHAPVRAAPPAETPPADAEPTPEDTTPPGASDQPQSFAPPRQSSSLVSWQAESPVLATAADFSEPVSVRGWAGLVLLLHSAIHPGLNAEDSSPRRPLWIDFDPKTDYDPWPKYAALAASATELVGGVLIGIGLLTRLSALGVAGVMLGAIWLTVIGPAIQSGQTVLGILPDHAVFDNEAWTGPMWLLSLLCCSLALCFAGPGTLSVDRLLLGGPPKPPPPKPAPPPPTKK